MTCGSCRIVVTGEKDDNGISKSRNPNRGRFLLAPFFTPKIRNDRTVRMRTGIIELQS